MDNNVLLFLENRTEELGNNISLGMKSHVGWKELTFKGLSILSKRLAGYLIDIGIDKGAHVAILSESTPEFGVALFASAMAGATIIPLDIKLTIYELTSILESALPTVMLVSSAYLETAKKLKEVIPSIEHIILIDDNGVNKEVPSLYTIGDKPGRKWRHRNLNATAFIIYTSGTTGKPKGVEITFKNILAQVDAVGQCFDLGPNDRLLSILPMNHLFELTVGFLSFLNLGVAIYYSKSLKPKDLFAIMTEKQITFMVVVPAFLKLLKVSIESEINKMSKWQKLYFNTAYEIAKVVKWKWFKKLAFKRIHKKYGGKFKGFLSGGAPLDIEVGKFFNNIGLKIYEGYGLSEASPVVTMNTDKNYRLGSVGKALFNVQAKTDPETGELLVKGQNVMKGYFNQPELTESVFTQDGWLKTGDIAKIDEDGFVWITGRIKNMIVLSGGKKVFPEEVESVLQKSDMFKELCVFGAKRTGGQKDGCEDVSVVVRPTDEILQKYQNDEELNAVARKEVKLFAEQLSPFKRPTSVVVTREDLPRTPTSKIKRKEVKALFEN
ncbi:AMP-binding protein [bacterium]|nr:AMP-binding protein [bacterium]